MALEKRIVTLQDQEVLFRRPVEQLSNFELLSVVEAGTRLAPSLTEVLRRLRNDSSFIDEMFEFGESQTAAIGNKFKSWFSSHLGDTPNTEALIISEISKSKKYGERAEEFMPDRLKFYFDGFSEAKKFKVINSWLTCLEFPERFFKSSQGMITPVILAIKHLSNYGSASEINDGIETFFRRYEEKGSHEVNSFISGPFRAAIEKLVRDFVRTNSRDFSDMANFAKLISRFDNKNFENKCNENLSEIQRFFTSRLISDEYIEHMLDARIKCMPSSRDTMLSEINSERSFRVISKFYSRSELMDGGRKIKGYLIGDELGL
ncbi:hypothetical protein [Pseudomonas putida]|uniref:Uncharacterized protein n=1 Tax=Pseudomonas putida TaxID=303 RepID=A0A8I1JG49_PSEPU|nr:hypothetical protein [Pseudomonas putida]MBI6882457.1 hypothetical protein [Pseudomonas putida]